ncbi:protein-glutamate O-methyltransferase CheR [Parendozoicomonas sp. Alg238-R29]|uniref:CheR family methyltransferase n=1 Tax=Parendozoicomonas sp. Alg238-R29 TaxID=2993446 RepID=UPI00248E9531|nr:protein-glutamate O-methyltransferase CheR [Parendozoicomonas sp. Alg238-R29]
MPIPTWMTDRLPDLTRDQFERWQSLLEERTGNHFSWQHRSILQAGLVRRMRELELRSYDEYLNLINEPSSHLEWTTLVENLTVRETRFFRHQPSCNVARNYLDTLLESSDRSSIEAWSVGCSTGEEAWTLAMLIHNKVSSLGRVVRFGVTATDISLEALAHARKGIYKERLVSSLEPALKERFFQKAGPARVQVVERLRERVCFARVNVLDLDRAPMRNMDLIFCQNLLIYFRRWRRIAIIEQLVKRLAPGGLLVLGPGEITNWQHPELEPVGNDQTLAFVRRKL